MLQIYEELRSEIRHYAIKEIDYPRTIKLCFHYLEEIKKLKNVDVRTDKKFIYFEIALNSKKNGDYNTAIKYGLIALNYLDKEDINGSKEVSRLWLLAAAYYEIGNIEESIKIYRKCSKILRNMHEENQRSMVIFNLAKSFKNYRIMKKVIKIYETKTLKSVITTQGDMEYDDILTSFYNELVNLYILDGKQEEAFQIIYGVRNKSLRKELALKLVA